jgi:trigger factor
MNVEKKDLEKSQVELLVSLTPEEFKFYIKKGAEKISKEVKIEGFRPGKVPYDILKQKIGEMSILEEAAHIAIHKTMDKVLDENLKEADLVGRPKVEITKLAPENPFEYKIIMAVSPEIKLGDYKSLKIKQAPADVTEEEIQNILNDLRDMRVKESITEEPVKDGDKIIADISIYLDNVPVDGGQNKDAAVIIGKNYIVPGFDKKLIGAKKNEEKSFSLPYPKDFHMKNLAGKMADFKVKIKEVYDRQLPELDDSFAVAFGVKNYSEFKDNVKKSLEDRKSKENIQVAERKMLDKIVSDSRFGDIPEMLINHESEIMQSELEQAITQQGGKMEDYLSSLKKTREQMILDMLPDAVKRVKATLVIRMIAKIEDIKISEEEVRKNKEELKNHYKDNKDLLQRIDTPEFRNYIVNTLTTRKTIDKLRDWNIEK